MGKPAARVTDLHTCPMFDGPKPHVGGPIIPPCAVTVLTGGLFQARVGDMAICVGPPDTIALGSPTVFVCGMMAARMGDMTMHGGVITLGLPTVLIGEAGSASVGGGGGGAGMGKGGGGEAPAPTSSAPWAALGEYKSLASPAAQADTLKAASADGTPFCERCNQSG